ncbi:MAG TPA: DUF484 family protein [Burkholderiaceae bacterium]|nr:DUF484 family protein [Burkholderiaceae bacterium]
MQVQDIANYLSNHPDFFDEHPELLATLQLPHPHNGQAISLIERQSLMLRERIRTLETRVAEMVRNAQENDAISARLATWTRSLLLQEDPARLPEAAIATMKEVFSVPHCALRLWSVKPEYAALECAKPVAADTISLANSMRAPFCGSNVGFEAATWFEDAASVQSLAMLPLRVGADPATFGLLVLGSADKDRFHITMGTTFLERIAELASAALARLRG